MLGQSDIPTAIIQNYLEVNSILFIFITFNSKLFWHMDYTALAIFIVD